jgi:hypothetical protein
MKAIHVRPTGIGAESWSVTGDGVLLFNIRLVIHATGRGEYYVLKPDRPDLELYAQLSHEGTLAFTAWDQEAVREILTSIVKPRTPGAELTIEVKHPLT